jgi:hypothetical protein
MHKVELLRELPCLLMHCGTHLHFLMCTTLFCSRSTPGATSTPALRSSLSPTSQKKPHDATAALTSAAHCVGLNSALQEGRTEIQQDTQSRRGKESQMRRCQKMPLNSCHHCELMLATHPAGNQCCCCCWDEFLLLLLVLLVRSLAGTPATAMHC